MESVPDKEIICTMKSIERDRKSRYLSQVSILFKETSISMISSVWYRVFDIECLVSSI